MYTEYVCVYIHIYIVYTYVYIQLHIGFTTLQLRMDQFYPLFDMSMVHRCGSARIACHTLKKVSEG